MRSDGASAGPLSCVVFMPWPEACFRPTRGDLAYLKSLLPADARVVNATTERAFLKALPTATHALVWYFRREWFAKAPHLRVLSTPAAGRELVPVEGPAGVRIHFGHFHGEIMAESVAAFILAWARGFLLKADCVWPRVDFSRKIYDVAGTKAVVIGYGHVGRAIGRKLKSFGVEVFGYSRHLGISPERLRRHLNEADWLVMALPGGADTEKFLDARLIAKLPRRCVVVNVGRGSTVDEEALFSALSNHRLSGAYLDVRTTEPYRRFGVPGGTVGLPPTPTLDNLVLMPHAAAFSNRYIKGYFDELKHDGCI